MLTTYALLPRDTEHLLPVAWHIAVLDEAQAIKNANAKTTGLVCRLDARHRLCLTGTPVENHLGELWSQFAFLMPGLLGDARRFARVFRTPIEKKQDGERRAVLSGRVKPFLLRRTKAVVAADLPPKTEILQPLELSGAAARSLRDRAAGDAREGARARWRKRGSRAATSSCSTRS